MIGECQRDIDCVFPARECIECEDPETMIYTQCGSEDVTCDTLHILLDESQCIEKCQCIKPETPIYDTIK